MAPQYIDGMFIDPEFHEVMWGYIPEDGYCVGIIREDTNEHLKYHVGLPKEHAEAYAELWGKRYNLPVLRFFVPGTDEYNEAIRKDFGED